MRSQFVFKPPALKRVEGKSKDDDYDADITSLEETISKTKDETVKKALQTTLNELKDNNKRTLDPGETPSKEPPKRALFKDSQQDVKRLKPKGPSAEEKMVQRWTDELNTIVSRGLAPLMRVLGIVAARLRYDDVRPLMMYKEGATIQERLAVVEPADSVESFIEKNRHVGNKLLYAYISTYQPTEEEEEPLESMKSNVDGCFNLDLDNSEDFRSLIANTESRQVATARKKALAYMDKIKMESSFAPAWAFETMSSGIFRAVLSVTCLGAFEAALAQVRRVPGCSTFTMKELICSPSVGDQFGFLVASTYLSSGDDLSGSNRAQGRHSKHSTYLNVMALRHQLAESIYTAKIWFESVYARENPLLKRFDLEKQKRLDAFRPMDQNQFRVFMDKQLSLHMDTQALEKTKQLRVFAERSGIAKEVTEPLIKAFEAQALRVMQPANDVESLDASGEIRNAHRAFWDVIFREGPPNMMDRCNEVLKEIMASNLDRYKDMLPQRELVYQG